MCASGVFVVVHRAVVGGVHVLGGEYARALLRFVGDVDVAAVAVVDLAVWCLNLDAPADQAVVLDHDPAEVLVVAYMSVDVNLIPDLNGIRLLGLDLLVDNFEQELIGVWVRG